jgi:hypothetical protein
MLTAVTLLIVLIVAGLVLGGLYKERITQLFLREVNKQLAVRMEADRIDLSFLSSFPQLSIVVSGLRSEGPRDSCLVEAENVSFRFNLSDIWKKKYRIRNILVRNARINLVTYADGHDNFHILKQRKDTAGRDFSFELQKIRLRDVGIRWIHVKDGQVAGIRAVSCQLMGDLSGHRHELDASGKILLEEFIFPGVSLTWNQPCRLNLSLTVDNPLQEYMMHIRDFSMPDLSLEMSGWIKSKRSQAWLDLSAAIDRERITGLLPLLPQSVRNSVSKYLEEGLLSLQAEIKGDLGKNMVPSVTVDFLLSQGRVREPEGRISLDNLSLQGIFTNGGSMDKKDFTLLVKECIAESDGLEIKGSGSIKDFRQPVSEFRVMIDGRLEGIRDMLRKDPFSSLTGEVGLDLHFSGRLQDVTSITRKDLLNFTASGTLEFRKASFKLKESPYGCDDLGGSLRFSNSNLAMNELRGRMEGCNFRIRGWLKNFLPFMLLPGENLYVEADLMSDDLQLDKFFGKHSGTNTGSASRILPARIRADINLDIHRFSFRKFRAEQIRGGLHYTDGRLGISALTLRAMDGKAFLEGTLQRDKDRDMSIFCNARLTDMDVQKLFAGFGNFGQDALTDKHLKGLVTADMYYKSDLKKDLSVSLNTIYAFAKMELKNGELIGYKPLESLSRFLSVEDLKHIRFSTLKNQIEIKDRQVIIPDMEIRSSTLDLFLSGTHSFDNVLDYRLRLLLSDLLFGKAKKRHAEVTEFGVVEDDGLGRTTLYLRLTGTPDDPRFSYDTRSVFNKIGTDLRREKQNLKQALKEEFRWLARDTASVKQDEAGGRADGKSTRFRIEWEEEAADTPTVSGKKAAKKKEYDEENGFEVEWEEDTAGTK